MARGGRDKDRSGAERKCIATGDVQPKEGLIRFVVGPEARIVPDLLEKLPGRGIWVAANRAALEAAVQKSLFARGAKQAVTVPDDLLEQIERQLAARVINLVALARKSGEAVCGFEKVKAMLANGKAKVLLQASDGSERGKTKLWTPEGGRYFSVLTASELGLAFGRQSVIHSALSAGGLATRVVEEASKLKGVREAAVREDSKKDGELRRKGKTAR